MQKVGLQLFKARDAEESYAIKFPSEAKWLALSGFGSELTPIWSLEIQSEEIMDRGRVDWETVLERTIEAYRLSDPVVTSFKWPERAVRQCDSLSAA